MQTFSISQLSQFSGIKPHTIRIWEQRYNALTPLRTEGNIRFYDDNQLRRLLNIVSLQSGQLKISELCLLNDDSLYKLLQQKFDTDHSTRDKPAYYISQLILAGISYREDNFNRMYEDALNLYGISELYTKVLYPVLIRLGLMWSCDNIIPPQEHFICNLLKQKLYSYIDSVPFIQKKDADWVLLLPENEFHELGLLMAHIVIKKAGKKVIYLGANIPSSSFINTVNETNAKNVLLFSVHAGQENIIKEYVDLFVKQTNNKNFYITGNTADFAALKNKIGIKFIDSFNDLEEVIK